MESLINNRNELLLKDLSESVLLSKESPNLEIHSLKLKLYEDIIKYLVYTTRDINIRHNLKIIGSRIATYIKYGTIDGENIETILNRYEERGQLIIRNTDIE